MTTRQILETLYRLEITPSVKDGRLHLQGATEPPPDLLDAIRTNKAATLALLGTLPTFTPEQERTLADWYCQQPRTRRLEIHRRGLAMRRDRQWPFHVADLAAMREAMDGQT